jgi:hypothetical protein
MVLLIKDNYIIKELVFVKLVIMMIGLVLFVRLVHLGFLIVLIVFIILRMWLGMLVLGLCSKDVLHVRQDMYL